MQTNFSKHSSHYGRKLLLNEFIEKAKLTSQENAALRELVLEVQNESGKTLRRIIREEVYAALKEILKEK